MNDRINIIGNNVKKLRKEEGLSQTQFAELVGTHQAVISKLENGMGCGLHVFSNIISFFEKRNYSMDNIFDANYLPDKVPLQRVHSQIIGRKLEILKEEINSSLESIIKNI